MAKKRIIITKQEWEEVLKCFDNLFPEPKNWESKKGKVADDYRQKGLSLGSGIFSILNISVEKEEEK